MKMFSKIGKLLLCGVAVAMIGCTDYDKDIQSVAGDVAQNATEIKNLDNAIKALEAKLAADYATKQELNAVKTALEGTIDTEVAALQAAIADAVKDLANAEDVAAVEASVKTLQAAAADAAAAIEATDVKVGAIDERLTAVETAIEAIDEVAEQVLADVESLKNGYMETVAFAQQAQANIDALTEQTVDLEGQVAALEAMVDEMAGAFEERINTLGQTIGNLSNLLTDEVAALQLADEEIYAKIEMVEGAVTAVNNLIGDLQTADEEIYVELNKALAYIGNVAALIEDEAAARANEDEQILLQLNKATETISAVIVTVADLETVVAEVKDELDLHVAAYEAYVAATEAKFQELLNTFASLSPVISTLQAQNAELKATLESLSPEIEAINAKVAELKSQMTSLEPVIAALQGQTKELLSMLNSLAPIINELKDRIGELRSIVFAPEVMYDGVPAVEFKSVYYTYKDKAGKDVEVNIALPAYAYYHFNPSSFDIEKAYYTILDREIETKTVSTIASVTGVKYAANGTVEVELLRENLDAKANFFALEATIAETGTIIRSDYAMVVDQKEALDYALEAADPKKPVYGAEDIKLAKPSFQLVYNSSLDLNAAVKAVSKNLDLAKYGFKVVVSLPKEFQAENVNQQASVKMENGVLTTNPANSKEAIGRTPIVMFELVDANDVVLDAVYAKVQVVVEREADFKYTAKAFDKDFVAGGSDKLCVTWEEIRENVYKAMNISQDEFYYTYIVDGEPVNTIVDAKGVKVEGVDTPVLTKNADDKSAYELVWTLKYSQLPAFKGTTQFVAVVNFVNLQASSERPTNVTIEIPVNVTKAPEYKYVSTATIKAERVAFEVKDILRTLKALYDLPNTKETLAEAAKAIAANDLDTALKLLGGVPGLVKEQKTFTATQTLDALLPVVPEADQIKALEAVAKVKAIAAVEAENVKVMEGVLNGNWGKIIAGLDILEKLPGMDAAKVATLKASILSLARYTYDAEDVTVATEKIEK